MLLELRKSQEWADELHRRGRAGAKPSVSANGRRVHRGRESGAGDRGVFGAGGFRATGVRAGAGGGDGAARIRPANVNGTLFVGALEWGANDAKAGARVRAQFGSDVAVPESAPRLQDDRGLSQRQRGSDQRSGGRVSDVVRDGGVIWERVGGHRREQVQSGQQQGANFNEQEAAGIN